MSNEWDSPVVKTRKPGRRWLRWLLWIAGSFVVLLVVVYFVATSAWFLRGTILPRVSKAANASITVTDAQISPFSTVILRGLKVQPQPDMEPLATFGELSARYSLFDIIGGNINVSDVVIKDPVIQLVENADGTSNLDPLLKRPESPAPPEPEQKGEKPPPQISLGQFQISNATVRKVKRRSNGGQEIAEISNFNLTLSDVGNGKTGSLKISSDVRLDDQRVAGVPGTNLIQAELNTTLSFGLTSDLKPQSLSGDIGVDATQLPVGLRQYAGAGVAIHCDVTPTDIEQFSIVLKQKSRTLAKIAARGPLDLAKQEGRIKLDISGIDRNALNLVGAQLGIDFGKTTVTSSHDITLADGGQSITAAGKLSINQLSAERAGSVSPEVDLQFDYAAGLNRAENTARIKLFTLSAAQNNVPFINGALSQPTTIALSNANNAVSESAFNLAVTNLNLRDWKALIGDYAALVNLNLALAMKDAGRKLDVALTTDIADIAAAFGSNKIAGAGVSLAANVTLTQFTNAQLSNFRCDVTHQKRACVGITASGTYNTESQGADVQTRAEVMVPELLRVVSVPDVAVSSGSVVLNAHAVQKAVSGKSAPARSVTGDLAIKDLVAKAREYALDRFQLNLDFDAGAAPGGAITLRKLNGRLEHAGQPAGSFEIAGNYQASNAADVSLKLVDLNQSLIAPLARPALADKAIESISINADTTARMTPAGDSSIAGNIQVKNVVIRDPSGKLPKEALGIDVKLDGNVRSNLLAIRDVALKLSVADVPGCALSTSGEINLATKAARVKLNIADLNQNAIRPFAASALGDKTLKSVAITADLAASFDPKGESSVRGDLGIKDLLVIDPSGGLPAEPLTLGLKLDGSLASNVSFIRNLQLQLSPTARANNMLSLTGRVDFSRSNALDGEVLVSSEALDVTPYYDMFVGPRTNAPVVAAEKSGPATGGQSSSAPATTNKAPEEPAPVTLPIRHFGLALNINRFYLREVVIRDWKTVVAVDGSRIAVKPFEMIVNNAPMRANVDANLGVPGYEYAVNFTSERLTVAPIVNSFAPDLRGKANGDLIADLQVRGAGVTGKNLQKNLSGLFGVQFTNCNLQITSPKAKTFLNPIAFLLGAPEMLNTPLNGVLASGRMGSGIISVQQVFVGSPTFTASTAGDIKIAEAIGKSPINNWPVRFGLQRTLAERVGMAAFDSSGSPYVNIPDFLKVGGTLENPEPLLNKSGIATSTAKNLIKSKVPSLNSPSVQQPSAPSAPSLSAPSTPTAPSVPSAPSAPSLPSVPGLR